MDLVVSGFEPELLTVCIHEFQLFQSSIAFALFYGFSIYVVLSDTFIYNIYHRYEIMMNNKRFTRT